MGGKLTNGQKVPYNYGIALGEGYLEEFLGPYVSRGVVAGSVRRERPRVGDVDVVVIPTDAYKTTAFLLTEGFSGGEKKMTGIIDGIQMEIYLATEEDFGAQLLMWTGSDKFNIRMRGAAKAKGWTLNQYGLFDGETCLASKTEEEIFSALEMEFVLPAERSK